MLQLLLHLKIYDGKFLKMVQEKTSFTKEDLLTAIW